MIYVDGTPFPTPSSSSQGSNLLDALMDHPFLVSTANSFRDIPVKYVSEEIHTESSIQTKCVYVFQREYATVDPSLVDLAGTDESTTCVGLVIRNRQTGMTSISHMDFPGVVDVGITQMLSLIGYNSDALLDVHLIGGFEDATSKYADHSTASLNPSRKDGYSFRLCAKLVETLQKSQHHFHFQTLFVLCHNTRWDSEGNAHPIIKGVVVKISTGSVFPASFDKSTRCPDEIVRRVRVCASDEDPSWKGKLLETYDTQTDQFMIAPCSWTQRILNYARQLQNLSNSDILLHCSTSPSDESPDFVDNERRIWKYLIQHPDWRDTFPGRRPRIFERSAATWVRLDE